MVKMRCSWSKLRSACTRFELMIAIFRACRGGLSGATEKGKVQESKISPIYWFYGPNSNPE